MNIQTTPPVVDEHFVEVIAERIASRIVEKLKAEAPNLALHQLPGCKLTGLRLSQFERFCAIMRANPSTVPYHAAQQALAECPGRGGYTRASTLQRYAGMHRKFW